MARTDRILLIEDSDDDAFVARRALTRAGFAGEITHLANAGQAMAYLGGDGDFADRARFPLPQSILLDLSLPDMPGLDVLKWIKDQSDLRCIAVIVFTGARDMKLLAQAYQLGADSCLSKDADAVEVQNLIHFMSDWTPRPPLPPGLS